MGSPGGVGTRSGGGKWGRVGRGIGEGGSEDLRSGVGGRFDRENDLRFLPFRPGLQGRSVDVEAWP